MKKLVFLLLLVTSCTGLRVGVQDSYDTSRYAYIDTDVWISITLNEIKPIKYYRNFDMKLDKCKVDIKYKLQD